MRTATIGKVFARSDSHFFGASTLCCICLRQQTRIQGIENSLQLWCLTIRVKAAGRSKVGSLEYKSYRVRCRKTGTGKRSKYRVKQPVFIEVRSIASRWESLSIARYRIWCGNSLRKKKLRTQSSVATLKSAIDWMRSPVQTRTRSLTRTTGAVSVTDSFHRLKIPLFFPCGNVNTG